MGESKGTFRGALRATDPRTKRNIFALVPWGEHETKGRMGGGVGWHGGHGVVRLSNAENSIWKSDPGSCISASIYQPRKDRAAVMDTADSTWNCISRCQ